MVVRAVRRMCLAAALLLALAGCGAIDAYRSVRGLDKSDPDPATAPFSKNLAAGEVADYPNLSTVPPPPTTASTTAERTALTQKLVAERTTAEADLGTLPAAAPAQAPVAGSPAKVAAAGPAVTAAPSAPVAPAPASAPPTTVASAVAPPETAVPDTTAPPPASARQRGRQPKEAPPQESSLQMPVIPTVPEGEATQPPPPTPHLGPAPSVQTPATTAAVAVPVPAPPPPVPAMAAPAPPPPLIPAATEVKRAQAAASVAAFDLADPPRLVADQRARLGQVAEAFRSKPGTVKIVAYAAPAPAGAEQLASFRAALDRAQVVAAALAEAGIPSNKIQTEASPAGAGASVGRVEVRLVP